MYSFYHNVITLSFHPQHVVHSMRCQQCQVFHDHTCYSYSHLIKLSNNISDSFCNKYYDKCVITVIHVIILKFKGISYEIIHH